MLKKRRKTGIDGKPWSPPFACSLRPDELVQDRFPLGRKTGWDGWPRPRGAFSWHGNMQCPGAAVFQHFVTR
jgi:hypothetical protein